MATVCIIINRVNRVSLIAGCIAAVTLQRTVEKVQLVDIRDIIPEDCDSYLWLDSGSPKLIAEAVVATGTISGAPKVLSEIASKSTVIESSNPTDQNGYWFCTAVSKLGITMKESDVITSEELIAIQLFSKLCCDYVREDKVFEYYPKSGPAVMLSSNLVFDYMEYIVSAAIRFYRGDRIDFSALCYADEAILSHLENEVESNPRDKNFNKIQQEMMSNLTGKTMIGGNPAQVISTVDEIVYPLIRRLEMTKQSFIHISAGLQGMVAYSNEVIPESALIGTQSAFINLGFKC